MDTDVLGTPRPWANTDRQKGERAKYRRNRKIEYPPNSVVTDGTGGVLSRPLTSRLDCFGDAVEWLFGRSDEPHQWGEQEPQARGCALCKVEVRCAKVVLERIESDDRLVKLYQDWDVATARLAKEQRYQHPTWAAFVAAYEKHSWPDSNDLALATDKESKDQAARTRKTASASARRKSKKKHVPQQIVAKIAEYRDDRIDEMKILQISPSPPLWISNRSPERRVLIADAWQARELLREAGEKASGRATMNWLIRHGRLNYDMPDAMVKRVEEALRKADKLIRDGVWPEFDPTPDASIRKPGSEMNPAVVYELLDD